MNISRAETSIMKRINFIVSMIAASLLHGAAVRVTFAEDFVFKTS
jgi:hypothetical protein